MIISKGKISQLEEIFEVYDLAKEFMRLEGNYIQWSGNYPSEDIIREDIEKGDLFVIIDEENVIQAVFSLKNYNKFHKGIEGEWLNEDAYLSIHRVASRGQKKGILAMTVDFAAGLCNNLRIDTHEDNKTMKKAILKNGFVYCGKIFMEDKSERLAYHLVVE